MNSAIWDPLCKTVGELLDVPPESITMDSSLLELDRNDFDSMSRIELALAIEEDFGIGVEDEEMESWHDMRDIYEFLVEALK